MSSRAIVTGGAGFIGSHVVDALLARRRRGDGHRRPLLRRRRARGRGRRAASSSTSSTLGRRSRRSSTEVAAAARSSTSRRRRASSSRSRTPAATATSTCRARSTCSRPPGASRRPVVFTSTGGALYGDEAPRPTAEDRIPAPLSPYGASKWAAEAYVNTWSLSSGIPHAVCRLGNVYGPRQSPHGEAGVVAIFSHHLYTGRPRSCTATARRRATTCTSATSSARCSPRRGARAPTTSPPASRPTCATVWTRAQQGGRQADRAGARRPAPGRAAAQPPRRRARRARARLAPAGADRRGAAAAPTRRWSRNSRASSAHAASRGPSNGMCNSRRTARAGERSADYWSMKFAPRRRRPRLAIARARCRAAAAARSALPICRAARGRPPRRQRRAPAQPVCPSRRDAAAPGRREPQRRRRHRTAGRPPRVTLRIDEPGTSRTVDVQVTLTLSRPARRCSSASLGWVAHRAHDRRRWPARRDARAPAATTSASARTTTAARRLLRGRAQLRRREPDGRRAGADRRAGAGGRARARRSGRADARADGRRRRRLPGRGHAQLRRPRKPLRRAARRLLPQGQDVLTAEGTPVVAPLAGTITHDQLPGGRRRLLRGRAHDDRLRLHVRALRGSLVRRQRRPDGRGRAAAVPGRPDRRCDRAAPALRDVGRAAGRSPAGTRSTRCRIWKLGKA